MTTHPVNPSASAPFPGSAEETLRLVTNVPAPAGLEDRVRAALHLARTDVSNVEDSQRRPNGSGPTGAGVDRRGRVLAWPSALKPQTSWMRTAAAAAIVFVVAGGGWGVYTRVEQNRPARILVMPPRVGAASGLSSAGAKRTPETLTGPKVSAVTAPATQAKGVKNAAPNAPGPKAGATAGAAQQ
jgi:hypothetical protein